MSLPLYRRKFAVLTRALDLGIRGVTSRHAIGPQPSFVPADSAGVWDVPGRDCQPCVGLHEAER